MGNFSSHMRDIFINDYTEEERRGVDKYLWRRFVYGGIATTILLVIVLSIPLCRGINFALIRSDCVGTWVLAEDYYDGFNADDRYIEFREEEAIGGDPILRLYKEGSKLGNVSRTGSQLTVQKESSVLFYNQGNDNSIHISFEKDEMILKYYESVSGLGTVILHSNTPSFEYTFPSLTDPEEITETYIRISKDYKLTEEQRADLY